MAHAQSLELIPPSQLLRSILTTTITHSSATSHIVSARMLFPYPQPAISDAVAGITSMRSDLSRIESLPTELIEHIASYLVDGESNVALDQSSRYSLCALRATSKTLKEKIDHTFRGCLFGKIVHFDVCDLDSLLLLALSKSYLSSVRILVFWSVGSDTLAGTEHLEATHHDDLVSDATAMGLPSNHVTVVLLLMIAFKGLENLKKIKIGASLQQHYPSSQSASRHENHPASMILTAAILSESPLEHIEMRGDNDAKVEGAELRVLDNFATNLVRFDTLHTLDLALTTRNCESPPTHIPGNY